MSSGAAALLGLAGGIILGLTISFFTVRRLIKRPIGGAVVPRDHGGIGPIVLSPGRQITDPDEAEALGLTADVRRM